MKHSVYLVLILLFNFCLVANSMCHLGRATVQADNHVLFGNNQLLRKDDIDQNIILDWVCKKETDNVRSQCSNGRISPIPQSRCPDREHLKPKINEINATDCITPAKLYSVGFESPARQFTELYSSCYDQDSMATIYVKHSIYKTRESTTRGNFSWTLDGKATGPDGNSYNKEQVYRSFNALLDPNQQYVTDRSRCIIHHGHLAPSADFYYMEHMRATFKIINSMPQFGCINSNGNWKYIEEYIRSQYRPDKMIKNIKTITLGVLELPHSLRQSLMVPMFLRIKNVNGRIVKMNPIPEWTIKIVDNSLVFATYNNPFATALPTPTPCHPIGCPRINNAVYTNFSMGYTICCSKTNSVFG